MCATLRPAPEGCVKDRIIFRQLLLFIFDVANHQNRLRFEALVSAPYAAYNSTERAKIGDYESQGRIG